MNNSVERTNLLSFFSLALESVRGRQAVSCFLSEQMIHNEQTAVLSIGKAAFSMLEGAVSVFGQNIQNCLLITKDGHLGNPVSIPECEVLLTAHPVPDERSLSAGNRLVEWLHELPADLPLLVLISGGTSSLVEKLPQGLGLVDIQQLNRWLLAKGLAINEMNRLRRSVSQIKGGRLLEYIGERKVTQLLISDVPNDDPAIIGSGLLINDDAQIQDSIEVPGWLHTMQQLASTNSHHKKNTCAQIKTTVIASNQIACENIQKSAQEWGYISKIVSTSLYAEVETCAENIMQYLEKAEPGCYIWGGEPTVKLPKHPGRGGRNQHLALLLAREIQGKNNLIILCAGTDGTDGLTDDAGALVDGLTIDRGQLDGFDVETVLANADAGSFLAASGDLINTGPTGTNVMDVVIALKQ